MRPPQDEFCFVHAADLHLGGRRWVDHLPSDPELRYSIERADKLAFDKLLELCWRESARFLLLAGDLFDGWCRDYRVALEFSERLAELRRLGCDTLLVFGNHDLRNRFSRPLLLPGQSHLLGRSGPETRLFSDVRVAIHGTSAEPPAAPPSGGDAAELYPPAVPGWFNIGLLHTSAEGRHGHADYRPCSRLSLRRKGYDYWALGHVHSREVLHENPWIVFPGNLQARGAREEGAKGATLVRVAAGRVVACEHRATDVLRFVRLTVDVRQANCFDDVLGELERSLWSLGSASPDLALIVQLELLGRSGAAALLRVPPSERAERLRQLLLQGLPRRVWVDAIWVDLESDAAGFQLDWAA